MSSAQPSSSSPRLSPASAQLSSAQLSSAHPSPAQLSSSQPSPAQLQHRSPQCSAAHLSSQPSSAQLRPAPAQYNPARLNPAAQLRSQASSAQASSAPAHQLTSVPHSPAHSCTTLLDDAPRPRSPKQWLDTSLGIFFAYGQTPKRPRRVGGIMGFVRRPCRRAHTPQITSALAVVIVCSTILVNLKFAV